MSAPFGTIAMADAMRGVVPAPPEMTPAQRHVARSIMHIRSGVAYRRERTFHKSGLQAAVARELVFSGLARVEAVTPGTTTFRLTHHAMRAALEPTETLDMQAFQPREAAPWGHPSDEF